MHLQLETFTVHKRFPLTISRGTYSESTILWLRVQQEGIEGWGEACPFSVGDPPQTLADLQGALESLRGPLADLSPWQRQQVEEQMLEMGIPSAARAAVDMALYDWMGKRLDQPLWRLWGLNPDHSPLTSVTIGINSPAAAQQRAQDWLQLQDLQAFKIKLGHPEGIAADQAMVIALQEVIPTGSLITVDANGGWTMEQTLSMCNWLAGQGVEYVEQPLEQGKDQGLIELWHQSPLPIFVDESCFSTAEIPALADRVHGINIKLMKSGGLTEALRMIHTARSHGLQVMIGCYGNTALANSAAAQLGPLVDYLDLDSHLNLTDDPFTGVPLHQGRLVLSEAPGLGVSYRS